MVRKAISRMFWVWDFRTQALGALVAGGDAIIVATKVDAARLQGCRPDKTRWRMEWGQKTADQGPIIFGYAWGTLSATEIAAAYNADPQSGEESDMVDVLQNILPLGYISQDSTASGRATEEINARTFRITKLPSWDVIEGKALQLWYLVPEGGTTLTSGTIANLTFAIRQGWLGD